MSSPSIKYLSIGGNRHTAAADSSSETGEVAFGADQNVAIWSPLCPTGKGISDLLRGHTDTVSAVKYALLASGLQKLITGASNGELKTWSRRDDKSGGMTWVGDQGWKGHDGSVNTIATLDGCDIFATGGADSKVKLWQFSSKDEVQECLYAITLKPRYIPLALALSGTRGDGPTDSLFVVTGGTRNAIQIITVTNLSDSPRHELQAELSGHEGWIRSLSLFEDVSGKHLVGEGDILLASASHDKYIRLWRFSKSGVDTAGKQTNAQSDTLFFEQTLTSKVQRVVTSGEKYSVTFEALLLGHEDWVYSVAWSPSEKLQLLSASADGSLAIWEADLDSGIWFTSSRLGEISGQKGATTATGSAGGFWTGLWVYPPSGLAVASLGRTGSWRLWQSLDNGQYWKQRLAVTGHVSSVNGLAWSMDGSYLLSTSSDQTTRLHAEWKSEDGRHGWYELARPQIHGYDLNCITSVNPTVFVSGADEKLLRVFDEPKGVAQLLGRLCKIEQTKTEDLPEIASIPVLGLSNKANDDGETNEDREEGASPMPSQALAEIDEPPTEDLLARHTLWPEHEKLYGHGYEISEAAATIPGLGALATACKASSIDHAVIRLYDTRTWHEIKPPLTCHSLTVTRLAFSSSPDTYLLSVGRDRQWTTFKQEQGTKEWKFCQSNPKAHTRMILDCAWSPIGGKAFFATAGRDRSVKIWSTSPNLEREDFTLQETVKCNSAVTAVSFTCNEDNTRAVLATGEEDGHISVHTLDVTGSEIRIVSSIDLEDNVCPPKAINRLAWRPDVDKYLPGNFAQLACASATGSVQILQFDVETLCK